MKSALQVIGVTGYAASGKTSLCQHLQRTFPSYFFSDIISSHKYLQQQHVHDPPLSSPLNKWPNKTCPQVFLDKGYNTQHLLSSVNETNMLEALKISIETAKKQTLNHNTHTTNTNTPRPYFLLVEDIFLLARASLLPYLDRILVLDSSIDKQESSQEVLCRRHYEKEYKAFCSFEEFKIHWQTYVLPSFQKWSSLSSLASLASLSIPSLLIDCLLSPQQILQQAANFLGLSSPLSSTQSFSASLSPSQSSSSPSSSSSVLSSVSSSEETKSTNNDETIICISDIHGHISKLEDLWTRLEQTLGIKRLQESTLIFLGDYCDRGPHTKEVLDWLIALKTQRESVSSSSSGGGKTFFLAGNHDFAFAAFLGCPPLKLEEGFDLDKTTNPHGKELYWKGNVEGGMHFQGRRWGGQADIYESVPSFASYGVTNDFTIKSRNQLLTKVPQAHKDFLQSLLWLHDQTLSFPPGRIICVHAGLVTALPLESQMTSLKNRCVEDASLQSIWGRFDALSGRREVLDMHPELGESALLVSGHHGVRKFTGNRFVLDLSGGKHFGALEAVVFSASGHQIISSKNTD